MVFLGSLLSPWGSEILSCALRIQLPDLLPCTAFSFHTFSQVSGVLVAVAVFARTLEVEEEKKGCGEEGKETVGREGKEGIGREMALPKSLDIAGHNSLLK